MRRLGLPRYEYTFRERSIGAVFFAYANENNSLYGALFAWYVIEHLKSYGINIEGLDWQTNNGYEFIHSRPENLGLHEDEQLSRLSINFKQTPVFRPEKLIWIGAEKNKSFIGVRRHIEGEPDSAYSYTAAVFVFAKRRGNVPQDRGRRVL